MQMRNVKKREMEKKTPWRNGGEIIAGGANSVSFEYCQPQKFMRRSQLAGDHCTKMVASQMERC